MLLSDSYIHQKSLDSLDSQVESLIAALPPELQVGGKNYANFSGNLSKMIEMGFMNLDKLFDSKRVQLSSIPFTTTWMRQQLGDDNLLYVGQLSNGRPDGFLFSIDSEGRIYEGFANSAFERNGFGRFIYDEDYSIGWWTSFLLNGNARVVEKDGKRQEGWWQMSDLIEPYHQDIAEYANFDDYLIKY